jgi:peroxiredoxin
MVEVKHITCKCGRVLPIYSDRFFKSQDKKITELNKELKELRKKYVKTLSVSIQTIDDVQDFASEINGKLATLKSNQKKLRRYSGGNIDGDN